MKTYDKLVRDLIPEIIENKKKTDRFVCRGEWFGGGGDDGLSAIPGFFDRKY